MIKLIIFDFDGVLANLKHVHYLALNQALALVGKEFTITPEEHIKEYDGLSTRKKLSLLVSKKSLDFNKIEEIFSNKQKFTIELMDKELKPDVRLSFILNYFKNEGYTLCVASNAIRATVEAGLQKIGILELFNEIYSNEDVLKQKPHPQIYLKCMAELGYASDETLIVEDSKHGREAAQRSGAFVCGVDSPENITYTTLAEAIDKANDQEKKIKWVGDDTIVLIPMAGRGQRFFDQGYKLPKPFIDVNGMPMIQRVVDNINISGQYVFVVQKEHYENYNLGILLKLIAADCEIVQVDGVTEGAACTTLLAKNFINNDKHLVIANSDQLVEYDSCDFMYNMISSEVDGGILTFKTTGTKWSYAKVGANNLVEKVAEKVEISNDATCGIYYYKYGKDYVKYAEQMISKNIRTNNEFYTCPVFNEFIEDNKKIKIYEVKKMIGLGTPEDLKIYLG